jgi:hypothetical protein
LEQKSQNLEYILTLANVTSRGKNMLMRDLNRMEEPSDGEEEDNQQNSSGED